MAIKLQYDNYTYYNPNISSSNPQAEKDKYKYDVNKFNKYITDMDYIGAANYAKQYIPNTTDRNVIAQYNQYIDTLIQQGNMMQKIQTASKNDKHFMDVAITKMNMNTQEGLANLRNKRNENGYADAILRMINYMGSKNDELTTPDSPDKYKEGKTGRFIKEFYERNNWMSTDDILKRLLNPDLVSKLRGDETAKDDIQKMLDAEIDESSDDYATKLRFTFAAEKQTALGMDWLAADNKDNFYSFLSNAGWTEDTLRDMGITFYGGGSENDSWIEVSKSNPHFLEIIKNLPNQTGISAASPEFATSHKQIRIDSYNSKGVQILDNETMNYTSVEYLQDIMKAMDDKEAEMNNLIGIPQAEGKYYSSTYSTQPLFDEAEQLTQLRANNQISENDYNRELNRLDNNIYEAVKAMSVTQVMYSNYGKTTEELDLMGVEQKQEIKKLISQADNKHLHFHAMTTNGQIGTLITIDSEKKTSDNPERPPYQVFIPNLFTERAAAQLNMDTKTRAINQLNNALDQNGGDIYLSGGDNIEKYTFENGEYVYNYYNQYENKWKKTNKKLNRDQMIDRLDHDNQVKDATNALLYKYTNHDGHLVDKDKYLDEGIDIAIMNIMSKTNNSPKHINGTTITEDDLRNFIRRNTGIGSGNTNINTDDLDDITYKSLEDGIDLIKKLINNYNKYSR